MDSTDNRRQIRRVLIATLVANLVVAGGKLAIGLLSASLAMVADGFHSLLDASSNVIGLVGNALAAQPPDDEHPYGHRRFETIAAMAVGGLLLITAWEIAGQAIDRLRSGTQPSVSGLSFAVMIGTMVVNIIVSRYERREGQRLQSELLLADAANTSADVFVSASVLISLVAVALGWYWADVVAALVVVVLLGRAAWGVLWQTGRVLVDTAPLPPEQVSDLISQVPGVRAVERVRSRGPADAMMLDVDVMVDPAVTADQAQAITTTIQERLAAAIPGIYDVAVNCLPDYVMPRDYRQVARAEANAMGLDIHEVVLFDTPEGPVLEMHVEVSPDQMLEDAHHYVTEFEKRVKAELTMLRDVTTHIEPAPRSRLQLARSARAEKVCSDALDYALTLYPDVNWHDVFIRTEAHGYALSMHGAVENDMTVEDAHLLAERTETHLRANLPLLQRVTIHMEPHSLAKD